MDDRGDEQVQSRGAVLLGLGPAIGDPALLEGADRLGQGVTLLPFVQPDVTAPPIRENS